jgi:hypothetical protein
MANNMLPDPALDTYLDGRFGTPTQGIVAPMWARNPVIETIASPSAGVETDPLIMKDMTTEATVMVIVAGNPPVSTAFNLDGTPFVGSLTNLRSPDDFDYGSEATIFCDGGNTFKRWVITKNGVPQVGAFDTSLQGFPYTVSGGPLVPGFCGSSTASDANLGANSALIVITTATPAVWAAGVGQFYDSVSVYNPDPTFALLVQLTFSSGTVAASDQEFLVHPNTTVEWTNERPVLTGASFVFVNLGLAVAGSVTDGLALPAVAPVARRNIIANFARK